MTDMDAEKNYDREPIFILCITKLYFHNTHSYPHAIKEGVHSLDIIYILLTDWQDMLFTRSYFNLQNTFKTIRRLINKSTKHAGRGKQEVYLMLVKMYTRYLNMKLYKTEKHG